MLFSLPSSSVISCRPKDPRFGWSSGSCLMLSTSGPDSKESFWGSAGFTKVLLGHRDGHCCLWGPPEEVAGGMVKVWLWSEGDCWGIVAIRGGTLKVWGGKVWSGLEVKWGAADLWGMEEAWIGMEELWGNIKEVWEGTEEGREWWTWEVFWEEGPPKS